MLWGDKEGKCPTQALRWKLSMASQPEPACPICKYKLKKKDQYVVCSFFFFYPSLLPFNFLDGPSSQIKEGFKIFSGISGPYQSPVVRDRKLKRAQIPDFVVLFLPRSDMTQCPCICCFCLSAFSFIEQKQGASINT